MVKRSADEVSEEKKTVVKDHHRHVSRGFVFKVFVLSAVFLLFAGVWFRPDSFYNLAEKVKNMFVSEEQKKPEVDFFQVQKELNDVKISLLNLNASLQRLREKAVNREDLKLLEDRIVAAETKNDEILNAKADSSVVMGLISRLDKQEHRLDEQVKLSDRGALILTAVMFVKDSAERGNSFVYEAEILKQMAEGEDALNAPVTVIENCAGQIIPSSSSLKEAFEQIYVKISKAEKNRKLQEKNWKEVLRQKFDEYVRFSYANEPASLEIKEKDVLQAVYEAVRENRIEQALNILKKPEGALLFNLYPALKEWSSRAELHVRFYAAVSDISSQALVLMKVNYLKQTAAGE